jgi:chromosome segregation ATPase
MDIKKFREAAERNTAQGIILNEMVTDYKELCEGLGNRNKQLLAEVQRLNKIVRVKDKLAEKKIFTANQNIVTAATDVDALKERIAELEHKNERLVEKGSKLALSNKQFEKENGMLTGKLNEAAEIMRNIKNERALRESKDQTVVAGIENLKTKLIELEEANEEYASNYDALTKRYDKLHEKFENYKTEVNDKYNPIAHMAPRISETVGKFLDLRENKGIEIESYWQDLKEKYGDSCDEFEDKIRGAKTLREATAAFYKNRASIDPAFAQAAPAEYAYRNRSERAALYESQGIVNPVDSFHNASVEQKNEEFLAGLKKAGLQ